MQNIKPLTFIAQQTKGVNIPLHQLQTWYRGINKRREKAPNKVAK